MFHTQQPPLSATTCIRLLVPPPATSMSPQCITRSAPTPKRGANIIFIFTVIRRRRYFYVALSCHLFKSPVVSQHRKNDLRPHAEGRSVQLHCFTNEHAFAILYISVLAVRRFTSLLYTRIIKIIVLNLRCLILTLPI